MLAHEEICDARCGDLGGGPLKRDAHYRDGTTHLVMTPLEFLQRLAALVPRPRLHLIRFHGVLAPNAALRAQIVAGETDQETDSATRGAHSLAPSPRARMSWAQLLKRVFAIAITTCPQCGGPLSTLAAIEDPAVTIKILSHLSLPTRAPPKAQASLDAFLQTASCPLGIRCSFWSRKISFAQFSSPHPTMERPAAPNREQWAGQTLLP